DLVAEAATAIGDVRGTAAYRRHSLAVMARRTLAWAWRDYQEEHRRCALPAPSTALPRSPTTCGRASRCCTCCASGSASRARRTPANRASAGPARCTWTGWWSARAWSRRGGGRGGAGARREGRAVRTVDGLTGGGALDAVQQAFLDTGAVQCGFCTPGLVVAADDLLRRVPRPADAEIREALAGNLCRCTGYEKILDAVRLAAE